MLWGAVLCLTGYSAASLASAHQMNSILPHLHADSQKCFQTLPDVTWEAKMETLVENNCFKSSHPHSTDEELRLQKERYRRASARLPGWWSSSRAWALAAELNCLSGNNSGAELCIF